MNKDQFVSLVSEKCSLTKKDTLLVLNTAFAVITDEIAAGRKVRFVGFGTFEYRDVAGRIGKNPQTKEPIDISPTGRCAFKAGAPLKQAAQKFYTDSHASKKRGRAKKK